MFRKSLYFALLTLVVSRSSWSDEPANNKQPIKQRVSPKVLQEAMALPEYQGKAPETPQQLLQDLQKLSEKLRKSGDSEGADLLRRFIADHTQMIKHTAQFADHDGREYEIHAKMVELNIDDLPPESELRNLTSHDCTTELRKEFDRVDSAKKRISSFSMVCKANQESRFVDGGEFPVPIESADGKVTIDYRSYGRKVICTPTNVTNDRMRLGIVFHDSEKDITNSVEHKGSTIPGVTIKCSFNETFDVKFGESEIHSIPGNYPRHQLFVILNITKHDESKEVRFKKNPPLE